MTLVQLDLFESIEGIDRSQLVVHRWCRVLGRVWCKALLKQISELEFGWWRSDLNSLFQWKGRQLDLRKNPVAMWEVAFFAWLSFFYGVCIVHRSHSTVDLLGFKKISTHFTVYLGYDRRLSRTRCSLGRSRCIQVGKASKFGEVLMGIYLSDYSNILSLTQTSSRSKRGMVLVLI